MSSVLRKTAKKPFTKWEVRKHERESCGLTFTPSFIFWRLEKRGFFGSKRANCVYSFQRDRWTEFIVLMFPRPDRLYTLRPLPGREKNGFSLTFQDSGYVWFYLLCLMVWVYTTAVLLTLNLICFYGCLLCNLPLYTIPARGFCARNSFDVSKRCGLKWTVKKFRLLVTISLMTPSLSDMNSIWSLGS